MTQLKALDESVLKQIELVALDVDGVMTQGDIIYTEQGKELKVFNAKDGHAINVWTYFGKPCAIITGRNSSIVNHRAKELGVQHVYQGIKNKMLMVTELAESLGIPLSAIAYMGDDWPDIPVLKMVGFATCPADAAKEVQAVCHWQSQYGGGKGAVREMLDLLIYAQQLPVVDFI